MNFQILLVAVLLSASISAAAKEKDSSDNKIRTWNATSEFHSVTVSDNVNIILAEDAGNMISVQGKARQVDAVHFEIKNGVLYVSSNRIPFKNKAVVYIPVRLLNRLTIKGGSEVHSMGYLQSAHLHIEVDGPCKMSVKNTGPITIAHDQDWELDYLKSKGEIIKAGNKSGNSRSYNSK